ncbi:class I SAM-dependent methyltransferase [Bradyrhizobium zhanjiangense]|uniref:Class I SAM-dependent methyltransferase n=1 Tax=Bradyrhizobium zhanjiangense TaxID=1325107 RepID=A0A4Q0QAU8_9BRAD|nr:methyltransferase domain-containing protein [Bradyrhizobium zhanjiangense]RXG86544.1 class I SAM-dependent methyltransferase [Bradyrhizobium zhanjiangense]
MDTLGALTKCKSVFGSGSERDEILGGLDERLARGVTLSWLEVGVGDGKNLQYLLESLGGSRSFVVTAIDPSPNSAKQIVSRYPIKVERKTVESFRTTKRYDCINARQCAYYFDNPPLMFLRLARLLSANGVLVATIWSDNCILLALNGLIANSLGSSQVALRPDSLIANLSSEEFVIDRCVEDCGSVSIAQLRAERQTFIALCALAARKIDMRRLPEGRLDYLLHQLENLERAGSRRENEIIFVRRRS